MTALDVLPLQVAKRFLNIADARTEHDTELLADFIPPAVERVERHLFGTDSTGQPLSHLDPGSVTATQLLACKVVLAAYWRTQRARSPSGGYGAGGGAGMEDSDPAGMAPLRRRLIDLLGPPAEDGPDARLDPRGSFPDPSCWPDPIRFPFRELW